MFRSCNIVIIPILLLFLVCTLNVGKQFRIRLASILFTTVKIACSKITLWRLIFRFIEAISEVLQTLAKGGNEYEWNEDFLWASCQKIKKFRKLSFSQTSCLHVCLYQTWQLYLFINPSFYQKLSEHKITFSAFSRMSTYICQNIFDSSVKIVAKISYKNSYFVTTKFCWQLPNCQLIIMSK